MLMERRADNLGVPRTPPYFPASLRALVRANDTIPAPATAFAGKRVLVLVGADSLLSLLMIVMVTVVSFVPFFEDVDDDDDSKYSTAVNELLQWWNR
jgi:hypothetical protein